MNIKFIKIKVLLIAIPVCCFLIIFNFYETNTNNTIENKVQYSKFDNKHGFENSYYIDVYNNNSNRNLKSQNLLLVSDVSTPIYFEFSQIGSSSKVIMNVFYDYNQVTFKVADKDYSDNYIFNIINGNKIKIPVYLKNAVLQNDDKIHKLFVTFTSSPDRHALDYDLPTDFFGINGVYDIVYTLDYKNEVYRNFNNKNIIVPDNNFEKNSGNLILNTDYENTEQNSSNGGILKPKVSLESSEGTPLKLMYNFSKLNSENCLLLITIGFAPTTINGNDYYQLIKLDGDNGTANGSIEVTTPDKSGLYEIIGYIVHNPFNKQQTADNLVKTSYRFTLNVNFHEPASSQRE